MASLDTEYDFNANVPSNLIGLVGFDSFSMICSLGNGRFFLLGLTISNSEVSVR
jgi:hypothetical protein